MATIPLKGDRSAHDMAHADFHASDIEDESYLYHVPSSATATAGHILHATAGGWVASDAMIVPLRLLELADTPATPAAGYIKVYAKTDHKVYKLGSDGIETEIGSGGGGSANLKIIPGSGLSVVMNEGYVFNDGIFDFVAEQTRSLSTFIPETIEKSTFILMTISNAGLIQATASDVEFDYLLEPFTSAPLEAIPEAPEDTLLVCALVKLTCEQTQISEEDIYDMRFPEIRKIGFNEIGPAIRKQYFSESTFTFNGDTVNGLSTTRPTDETNGTFSDSCAYGASVDIAVLVSDALNIIEIPAGYWQLNTFTQTSAYAVDSNLAFAFHLVHADFSDELLFTLNSVPGEDMTLLRHGSYHEAITVVPTDRIRLTITFSNAYPAGNSATIYYGSAFYDCHFTIPVHLYDTFPSTSQLTVEEIDGTPSAALVTKIKVTNGTMTDEGGGVVRLDFGSAATDGSAIHDNVASEISGITEKTSTTGNDLFLIEDSADSNNKKRLKASNLPKLSVQEVDGSPAVNAVTLKFPNGTLTDGGGGVVTYTPAGGSQIFPQRAKHFIDEFDSNGGITITLFANQQYAQYGYQTGSAAVNDWLEVAVLLEAGTYTVSVLGSTQDNEGILKWQLDGSDVTTGQDWYSATEIKNVVKTFSITVATSGRHLLRGIVTGKHASSSAYFYLLTCVTIAPAAYSSSY